MAEFPNNISLPRSRHQHAFHSSSQGRKGCRDPKKLIDCNASLSSLSFFNASQLSLTMFTDGFMPLIELRESVHDLIQLGSAQQSLIHGGIRIERSTYIEETLEGSLRLLDVCGTVKDAMSHMKTHLRELQSALRRRRREDTDNIENKISAYFNSKKQMKREIKNGLTAIKRVEEQTASSSPVLLPDEDDIQLCSVISVLREARLITFSILDSLLIVISASRITKSAKQFSAFQRFWMGKGRVSCDGQAEQGSEIKKVDDSLCSLLRKLEYGKHVELEQLREIPIQIEVLGESIQSLEDGIQGAFRRLIQIRAALLNFLHD